MKRIIASVILISSLSWFIRIDGFKTAWSIIPGALFIGSLDFLIGLKEDT